MQRRTATRYKLRLPVIFHWNDGEEHTEGGFTSDVSLDGASILSAHCPPVGSEIWIEVLIPSPEDGGEELRITCTGTVIRVTDQFARKAFGVRGIFDEEHLFSAYGFDPAL